MIVRGHAKFSHNVKVEGWLEAPNIKDINKGIFATYGDLLTHYPTANDGWMAGVIEIPQGEEEAQITAYIGIGGQWVRQNVALTINMDVEELIRLRSHLFVNAKNLFELDEATTLADVRELIDGMESSVAALYKIPGVVLTFIGAEGWETWRWDGETLEDWEEDDTWVDVDVAHLDDKVDEDVLRLDNKINLLAAGVKLTLGVSPTIIYKGTASTVTLTGSVNTENDVEISLYDGATKLGESSNNPYALQQSVTQNSNSKTYRAECAINGMTLNAAVTLQARYPIYYGFAASKPTTGTGMLKRSATTTAVGSYKSTVGAGVSGVHFYICVPSDISALSNFTMGGAPFVMNSYGNQTIDGQTYIIYESGNTYNENTELDIVAS